MRIAVHLQKLLFLAISIASRALLVAVMAADCAALALETASSTLVVRVFKDVLLQLKIEHIQQLWRDGFQCHDAYNPALLQRFVT